MKASLSAANLNRLIFLIPIACDINAHSINVLRVAAEASGLVFERAEARRLARLWGWPEVYLMAVLRAESGWMAPVERRTGPGSASVIWVFEWVEPG